MAPAHRPRERAARRHGLRLVPRGVLPGRGADRSAHCRRPRRRAGPGGDRGGRRDRCPAGDHRRDRHGQAVGLARRGTGPSGRRPRRPAHGPRRHDPRRPVTGRARPVALVRGGGRRSDARGHRARRLLSGSRALPRDRRARCESRVRLPRHELHAAGAPRRGPHRRAVVRAARAWPRRAHPAEPGRVPRRAARAATAATATHTSRRRSCRVSATPGSPTPRSRR